MATSNLGPYRLRPRGEFSGTASYRFLDVVSYDGGSYMCCNYDTIDGTSCIGVLPTGELNSELYWQCLCKRGEPGLLELEYLPIKTLGEDGVWDFDETDKVYIPESFSKTLNIENVYEGCCGIIITTNKNLKLPANSDYSIDFDYVAIADNANQYYMYSFVYAKMGGNKFIWHRTVINKS